MIPQKFAHTQKFDSNGKAIAPDDAEERRAMPPLVSYRVDQLPQPHPAIFDTDSLGLEKIEEIVVPPREAATFRVPAGHFFQIRSVEGPQVGDLNLWNAADLQEHFFSGKTRQLHASHVTTGDRLWSTLPGLRPIATITRDTLGWYGWDADGASVHDVIGTRCDPYTNFNLQGVNYHHCCHSNLSRALADEIDIPVREAESYIHDVMNVFMCTGFSADKHQYFMKASPVRPGDFIEFFAEIDLLGALSACPGGDCGSSHSDDNTPCFPLVVDVLKPNSNRLDDWEPPSISGYDRTHGR